MQRMQNSVFIMTESGELVCNIDKCRRALTTRAWVTSCLHAFCEEDGNKYVHQTPVKCPACKTTLNDSLDVIQIEVSPSERFKSMVLAGLKPDVICDVAGRALAFWMYQMSEDRAYLAAAVSRGRRRFDDLERYYEDHCRQLQSQITTMKTHLDKEVASSSRQLEEARHELETSQRQGEELSSRLAQRNKQYQQLQRDYDALRVRNASTARVSPALSPARSLANNWRPPLQPSLQPSPVSRRVSHVSQFVFKPVTPQPVKANR